MGIGSEQYWRSLTVPFSSALEVVSLSVFPTAARVFVVVAVVVVTSWYKVDKRTFPHGQYNCMEGER